MLGMNINISIELSKMKDDVEKIVRVNERLRRDGEDDITLPQPDKAGYQRFEDR